MLMFYLQMIETEEDQSKFGLLYTKYRQVMYAAAFKILKHKEDTEDAVHNAFVRIAQNIKDVDTTIDTRTKCFVITIVEHIAIDIYRQKKRRLEHEQLLDDVGIAITYDTDDILSRSIAKLAPQYRTALLLKYDYGYTLKEIAKIMNITESNAKNLTFRAKQKVADLYEKEEVR